MLPKFELIVQAPPLLLAPLLPLPPELLVPPSPLEEELFDELLHAVTAMTEAHPETTIAATLRLTLAFSFMGGLSLERVAGWRPEAVTRCWLDR
jgi:hypothetical protein